MASAESLYRAVYERRDEYIQPHRLLVKVGTWNVAACPGTDKDVASWFLSGVGVDKRLASVDFSNHPAVESEHIDDGGAEEDGNAVRLVGGDKIGLYVLGLQEVVDLNVPTQYVRGVYASDPGPMEKWKMALETAMPEGYTLISSEQLSGLLLLVYASPEVAPTIGNVSTVTVGTGLLGYLGNKGAVATRLLLGESTRMVFVNCHLASGNDSSYADRRIWDVAQIASRAQFEPIRHPGMPESPPEKIGDEDFAFWFGDLNFRLEGLPGDDIRRLLMLHTRGEYDLTASKPNSNLLEDEGVVVSRPSWSSEEVVDTSSASGHSTEPAAAMISCHGHDETGHGPGRTEQSDQDDETAALPDPDDFVPDAHDDPTSLQATLDSLLPHDQLRRLMRQGKVFQDGWREGPITFLPTYKYDVGTIGLFDSSEKRRAPSWCDRILFRTRKDKEVHERKLAEEADTRKKDAEMQAQGMEQAGDDDEVLFAYDPDKDGVGDEEESEATHGGFEEYDDEAEEHELGGQVLTREGFVDRINLDIYTSHQRITSSDHKPIIAVFVLDYDGAVPALKAKVHAQVARELDRAENEGRPGITMVVDGSNLNESQSTPAVAKNAGRAGQLVDFGDIAFLHKKTASLTLANTGRVTATFSFVEKPTTEEPDGSIPPKWLTTFFARSDFGGDTATATGTAAAMDLGREITLEPGDTVHAVLEAYVDDTAYARLLNDGQALLEDVLVLRVSGGRDHFVPVRAAWRPTCIGRSVEELIRVPDGGLRSFVRSLSASRGGRTMGSIPYDLDVQRSAPKELFKLTELVETLTERALADEQMIETQRLPQDAGWPFDSAARKFAGSGFRNTARSRLLDALDDDKPLGDAFAAETSAVERLEVAGEVLCLFLLGLTDGIIPPQLWIRIEQAQLASLSHSGPYSAKASANGGAHDEKAAILDILASAPNHNISFVFLTTTLAKIIHELAPLTKAALEALKTSGRGLSAALGRRSLSIRRSGGGAAATDALALQQRREAKQRRFAEIFASLVCRAYRPPNMKDRDRKVVEDKQRAVVELFLRGNEDT